MKRPTLCSIHLSTLPPKGNGINRSCPWISRLLSKHRPSITLFFFFLKFFMETMIQWVTSNFRKVHRSPWFESTAQITDAAIELLHIQWWNGRYSWFIVVYVQDIKKKKNPKTLRAYSTKGNKKMSNPTINLFDIKSIFIIFRNTFDTNVRVFSRDTLSVNIEFWNLKIH